MAKKKKTTCDEVEELDMAYTQITGRKAAPQGRSTGSVIIVILLAVILALCGLFLLTANYGTLLDDVLKMKSVTIGGIDLGGMTKTEAKAQLSAVAEQLRTQDMTIRVLDSTLTLSPAYTHMDPKPEDAVDAAFRSGATGKFDWLPYLALNTDAVRNAVDSLGAQYNTELSQSVAEVTGQAPSLAANALPESTGMTLTVTVGKPAYGLNVAQLYQQVLDAYSVGSLEVTGVCSVLPPELPDLDAIYNQYYIAPVDAVMDPDTFDVSADSYGYHFDLEAAKEALTAAAYGETLSFPFFKIPPKITAAELSSRLFCDVLGSAQTPYKGKDTNNRNTNIAVACEAINGLVLLPGESFSYNDTLGERTKEAGYKEAPSYVGGLTVDTLGGGICQVSSTLYYSTLFADLQIDERYHHGYVSDYIPKGMDATVTWEGADFRFTNNTNFPIRIEAWRADGYVNVNIIGTEERDYYIKMTYKVLETTPYDTIYEEHPAGNPQGYVDGQILVTPYTGYIVQTYKEKYHKETDELISKDKWTYDIYKKRDHVICKIVDTPSPGATE